MQPCQAPHGWYAAVVPEHCSCASVCAVSIDRRQLFFSGVATLGGMAALPAIGAATGHASPAGGTPIALGDEALLTAFVKARYALDERITHGWMDAMTYAFVDGAVYPLYRLRAGTWVWLRRRDATHFEGRTLETAYFFDPRTDELLTRLTMPVTGRQVDVRPYRAGPSDFVVGVRQQTSGAFRMAGETRDGAAFFHPGTTQRSQALSQPVRERDRVYIREDLATRVRGEEGGRPRFFYAEWTITEMAWRDLRNPRLRSADSTLQYSAVAAFRPWMQMDGVPGHTLQNGRGGKAHRVQDFPPRFLEAVRRFDPDLLEDPRGVLGERHGA